MSCSAAKNPCSSTKISLTDMAPSALQSVSTGAPPKKKKYDPRTNSGLARNTRRYRYCRVHRLLRHGWRRGLPTPAAHRSPSCPPQCLRGRAHRLVPRAGPETLKAGPRLLPTHRHLRKQPYVGASAARGWRPADRQLQLRRRGLADRHRRKHRGWGRVSATWLIQGGDSEWRGSLICICVLCVYFSQGRKIILRLLLNKEHA